MNMQHLLGASYLIYTDDVGAARRLHTVHRQYVIVYFIIQYIYHYLVGMSWLCIPTLIPNLDTDTPRFKS